MADIAFCILACSNHFQRIEFDHRDLAFVNFPAEIYISKRDTLSHSTFNRIYHRHCRPVSSIKNLICLRKIQQIVLFQVYVDFNPIFFIKIIIILLYDHTFQLRIQVV